MYIASKEEHQFHFIVKIDFECASDLLADWLSHLVGDSQFMD